MKKFLANVMKIFFGSLTVLIITVAIIVAIGKSNENDMKERFVTKNQYGEKWPFYEDNATIRCYKDDNDLFSPVVELDGKEYGLTGFADSMHGQNNPNAINKHWRYRSDFPELKLHVDLGDITNDAKKLCGDIK